VLAAAVMRRGVMHAEAEVRWHDELDATLAARGGDPPAGSLGGGAGQRHGERRRDRSSRYNSIFPGDASRLT
jgi:hypothetical protein